MTATSDKTPEAANPDDEVLTESSKAAVVIPLIIGGAIIVAIIILWNIHNRNLRRTEMTLIEEEVRTDLLSAYHSLRMFQPNEALAKAKAVEEKMHGLKTKHSTDYADLKMVTLLIQGESEMMIDRKKNAADAEKRFDKAISLMTHASGEVWQFGLLGRARARLELGRFQEAEDDLTRLLDRNPSFGVAYYWRSRARESLGNAKGAAEDADKAESLDSNPPLRDFMHGSVGWNRDFMSPSERRIKHIE